MIWLLRLYPRAWRERYGSEFAELLRSERLSPRAVLDVVMSALLAHGQVFLVDAASTIATLARVRPEIRTRSWLTALVALTSVLISGFRFHWTLEHVATFAATLSILTLALLSHADGETGRSARNAIIMVAAPVVALYLNLLQTSRGEGNPVLFAFLVSIPAAPWPDAEHLKALRISELVCYLMAAIMMSVGLVQGKLVPGAIIACMWLALGMHQRRRRLQARPPTSLERAV